MAVNSLCAKIVSLLEVVSLKDNAGKLTEFSNFLAIFSDAVPHVNYIIKWVVSNAFQINLNLDYIFKIFTKVANFI